jgi:hypothetical protein
MMGTPTPRRDPEAQVEAAFNISRRRDVLTALKWGIPPPGSRAARYLLSPVETAHIARTSHSGFMPPLWVCAEAHMEF